MLKWDFSKLSTVNHETNTHTITESFSSIDINTNTAMVAFAISADGKCKVECLEEEKAKHTVSIRDNTLSVKLIDNRHWYDHISIGFITPKITVYLPQAEYDAIAVKTSTGSIIMEKMTVGSVDLSVSTGKITLSDVVCRNDIALSVSTGKTVMTNVTCKNLSSTGSTGDIALKNVVATGKYSIDRNTGDVIFDGCDAAEIKVETSTGNVTGSLLTDKVIWASTNTGKVDVPKLTNGGKCEITTSTGNIKITIP